MMISRGAPPKPASLGSAFTNLMGVITMSARAARVSGFPEEFHKETDALSWWVGQDLDQVPPRHRDFPELSLDQIVEFEQERRASSLWLGRAW